MNQANQALSNRYQNAKTDYVKTQVVLQMIQDIDGLQEGVETLNSEVPTPIPLGVSLTASGNVTLQDGYGVVVPNRYWTKGRLFLKGNSIFKVS